MGVDYLKVDDMSGTPRTEAGAYHDYAAIRDALNATGRPIFFSTCGHSGPNPKPGHAPDWMGAKCGELANACRISADIRFWGPGTYWHVCELLPSYFANDFVDSVNFTQSGAYLFLFHLFQIRGSP